MLRRKLQIVCVYFTCACIFLSHSLSLQVLHTAKRELDMTESSSSSNEGADNNMVVEDIDSPGPDKKRAKAEEYR